MIDLSPLRRLLVILALALAATLAALLWAVLRPAAAADGTVIDLTPVLTAATDIVVAVLGAALVWLIRRAADWLHISRDSLLAERFEQGVVAALGYARERALAAGRDLAHPDVRSELVAAAATYLLPKIPDTLSALGIDAAGLAERLTARLDYAHPLPGDAAELVGRLRPGA